MPFTTYTFNGVRIAELNAVGVAIQTAEDALQLMGDAYYNGFDRLIVRVEQLHPDFFDLCTGLAGEILQKFAQYRMGLAIVGDFTQFDSQALADFIRESNKGPHVRFVASVEEALQ
jgi:hypothetical protein